MPPQRTLTPRRAPVQERSRETVDAVLDAAAQVFERHGYAAGTTNRIAQRAGVSIGSLYQYFPNKDAILVALTARHLEQGRARLEPLLARFASDPPPVPAGLALLAGAMVALHADAPRLHRVLFEESPRPQELHERLRQAGDDGADAIAMWLRQRPEATVPDARLAAELVVQVLESVTHGLVIHPRGDRDAADYASEAVLMLTRYLTAGAPERRA